ncbi:MAG: transglycosylase domain-containing protein [Alphaproteobacteria bacterium]|jgi:penicillin-binding protein 1A
MAKKSPSKSRKKPTPKRGVFRVLLKWALVAGIWATIAVSSLIAWYAYDLGPVTGSIPKLERRPSVTLLAADGTPFARFGEARARPIVVSKLPKHVPQAVVAVEDARFYSHFGVDVIGLARAVVVNLWAGRIKQGGSTITQQLAKNLFLGPERVFKRKIQELVLALWLEHHLSKDEILSLYLNRVYLGAGNFGIAAAARSYFNKPAKDLQLNEAAMLAGLLKAPSRYAPNRHRGRATRRAAVVLDRMVAAGFITPAQARVVKLNPARLGRQSARVGRYYADWALNQARGYVGSAKGDLVVQTTLDLRLQRAAERSVQKLMAGPAKGRNVGQAALVIMAPNGAVKAMVGGKNYGKSQFNRATQALRQPGSSFKPFVYLAGLESGLTPKSIIKDAPVRMGNFAPRNYNGKFYGPVTLTDGLVKSLNTVAVRVLQHAGIDRVIRRARRLGITSKLRREAGLALGASEVSLIELVGAYAPFANGGNGVFVHGVTRIKDTSGKTRYVRSGSGPGRRIEPVMLADMNKMMAAVMERGTGRRGRFGHPIGGKTGTTQDYRDAWFVGYSAKFVAGVWLGNDNGKSMKRVTGGSLPAKIWRDVMVAAHQGKPAIPLPGAKGGSFWGRLFGNSDPAPDPDAYPSDSD